MFKFQISSELSRSKTLRIFEKLNKDLLKAIRAEREYKMPTNYTSWETLSTIAALSLSTCGIETITKDTAAFIHSYRMSLWYAKDTPLYCLTAQLFEAFDNTNALYKPNILEGWKPSLPSFLITLPKGLLISPTGEIDYLVVGCSRSDRPEWDSAKWNKIKIPEFHLEHNLYFQWTAVDEKETVWFSGTAIAPDGSLIYQEKSSLGKNQMDSQDKQFVQRVRNLVINILLCLEHSPQLIEPLSESEQQQTTRLPASKKFAPSKSNVRYPRWLGKSYQRKHENLGGNHASPHTHWRRGHWRVLESGEDKRWKETKRIWIEPVLVNS